jgi:hypothetical protein
VLAPLGDGRLAVVGDDGVVWIGGRGEGEPRRLVDALLVLGGRRIVSASQDSLRVWDAATGRLLQVLPWRIDRDPLVAAVDPRRILWADLTSLWLWDVETGETLAGFTLEAMPTAVAADSAGHLLAGDALGRVHCLRIEAGSR